MKMSYIYPIVLITFIMLGCSGIKEAYMKAEKRNTIKAYENFLKEYPNDDKSKLVKNEIEALKLKRAEKLKEKAKDAIEQIAGYEPGKLTAKKFFDDGWNPFDPMIGKVGTLIIKGGRKDLWITMGYKINIIDSIDKKSDYYQVLKSSFDSYVQDLNSDVDFNYVIGAKIEDICTLGFSYGVLEYIEWTEKYQAYKKTKGD